MLLLLKQTATSSDRTQPLQLGDGRTEVDLGSFQDLLFGHHLDTELRLNVRWNTPESIDVLNPATGDDSPFDRGELSFETVVGQSNSRLSVKYLEYRSGDNSVRMERSKYGVRGSKPEYDLVAMVAGRDYLKRTPGRNWTLPAPVKCFGFPEEVSAYFQNSGFVGGLELEFERQFSRRTFYLGPLRSMPLRQYQWKGTHPDDVGEAGSRAVEALLASRESGRINARAFDARGHARARITVEQHVAEWLKELGLVESFEMERISIDADIYRVRVKQTANSTPVLLTDVGFGVSQILPVLVLLAYVPSGSTVLLEQPEIHLHPAVQSALADVIIEAARIRQVQVLVETHSEHLLRRMQLRVAEGKISPDFLKLYFCSIQSGESAIERLDLNLFGEILNWPPGFFGDPLGETAAIAKAAIRRQSQ